jgi:NADH-quinone oxidoreductase subunit N
MTWQPLALELTVCAWALLFLVREILARTPGRQSLWKLALAGVLACAAILGWQQAWIGAPTDPMFVLDRFAWTFKGFFLLVAGVVVLMTRLSTRRQSANVGEFYLLIFSAVLGMLVLASANDLILLFVGLELLTFSLYVMAAYLRQDSRSIEAGMKYLILGSISSGFLIYGISLLYGVAGGTNFEVLRVTFSDAASVPLLARMGLFLVLAGLGFKVAAVPFHLWVPDVYQGAPTPVVALLSTGSKMAGVVALLRLLYGVFWGAQAIWAPIIMVASAATILYGNLAALPQTNIKRLLGYSSISHAGYLLMGLSTATIQGMTSVCFYLLAYVVSNLAVFFVVVAASEAIGSDEIEEYRGLAKRAPLLAATLFIGLLSLAGVPPLAGFVGKLFVLLAAMDAKSYWLAAVGAANVAVSLYYYLMVIKRAYTAPAGSAEPIRVDGLTKLALLALIVGILAIGVVQEPFVRHVAAVVQP